MESGSVYGEDNYDHVIAGLIYITTSCPGPGVDMDLYNSSPKGCRCISSCKKNYCSCFLRYNNKSLMAIDNFFPFANSSFGPITECNDDCKCEKNCFNRTVQNGPRQGLEIVHFGAKGFGIITKRTIPVGAFVCEYAGEIIGIKEACRRFEHANASNSNYILVLREHCEGQETTITVIDPTVMGNIGRYLNHSCEPNTVVIPVRSNSLVPVAALFASKTIQAGEEICYDYDSLSDNSGNLSFALSSNTMHSFTSSPKLVKKCDSQCSHSKVEINKIEFTPIGDLSLSNSKKTCICLSQHCRLFLPSNSNLFAK